jgi:DNA-binding beta-propeller fold protein YncE
MFSAHWSKSISTFPFLSALIVFFSFAGSSDTLAQDDTLYLREARAIDTNDFGLLNATGLAFSFDANHFFVLEARSTTQANIATMTPFEDLVASDSVDVSMIDPINLAFDNRFNRLLLLDSGSSELVAIRTGPDGHLDPSSEAITRFQIAQLGLQEPRGMTIDPANGHLFILDSAALQIVRIEPDAHGSFDGALALNQGRVSWLDLTPAGLVDPRGLAFNPDNGHLYLLSPVDQRIYELVETGRVVAILGLPAFEFIDPQGLVFAPSGDATDDPSIINLYIADTGFSAALSSTAASFAESQATYASSSASEFYIYPPPSLQTANGGNMAGQELGRIMEMSLPIVYVPGNAPTIQAAIDLASNHEVVLVAPGLYQENIQLSGKTITLASHFHTTLDPSFIDQTIIDGGGKTVITVNSSVGPETEINGFTIQNGNDGISASARLHILNNHFTGNRDAIDYEAGGGICRDNVFENNSDDAVDLDGPTQATIENNTMRNNGDDGIEIRLHPYSGPTLNIIIRSNVISGHNEDGIQLIDYAGLSDRVFLIERNLIEDSAMVGLGLMDNGRTKEDFRGASIPERIHLFNNTFIDNDHGVTGGDNLIALNNIFLGSTNVALKNVDGDSIAAYNLFWGNGIDYQNSNVDTATTILQDPRLDGNYRLMPYSPAIDAGTAHFTWYSETVLDLQPGTYAGLAPERGAYETSNRFLPLILKPDEVGDALP